MEKPIDVIESGEHVEPNIFENEAEAILFHAYLKLLDYVEFLETNRNGIE